MYFVVIPKNNYSLCIKNWYKKKTIPLTLKIPQKEDRRAKYFKKMSTFYTHFTFVFNSGCFGSSKILQLSFLLKPCQRQKKHDRFSFGADHMGVGYFFK